MRPAHAPALALLTACGSLEQGPLPGALTGSVVLVADDEALAHDVATATTVEGRFPSDAGDVRLFVYDLPLAALQLETDASARLLRVPSGGRALPVPTSTWRWSGAWERDDDASSRERVRVPDFDAGRCVEIGCYEPARPDACALDCAPAEPIAPAAPVAPAPAEAPRLPACPAGYAARPLFEALEDCERPPESCQATEVRRHGSASCAPVDVCPPGGGFSPEPARWYVAPGGAGDGSAPGRPAPSVDAVRALAAPGDTISLAAGEHASPSAPLAGLTLVGACASGTTLRGALRLGEGAGVRGLEAPDGITVAAGRSTIEDVRVGRTLIVETGASLTARELHLVLGGSVGITVASATVAIDGFSIRGASVAFEARSSSVTLARGAIDECATGLLLHGGAARLEAIEGDRPRGVPLPTALLVDRGGILAARELWLDGALVLGGGASASVEGGRTRGLQVDGARLEASGLRVIGGALHAGMGATLALRDALRAETERMEDEVRSGTLTLERVALIDASLRVDAAAEATLSDLTLSSPSTLGYGVYAWGRMTVERARAEGLRFALGTRGELVARDLTISDVSERGVWIDLGAEGTIERASMQALEAAAIIATGFARISDLQVTATLRRDAPAIEAQVGLELRRATVALSGDGVPLQIQPHRDVASFAAASVLEDLELEGGLYASAKLARVLGLEMSRARLSGSRGLGLSLDGVSDATLSDLDVEQPPLGSWNLLSRTPDALTLERFRFRGAAGGASFVSGARVVLRDGVLSEHSRIGVELPRDISAAEALVRVVVRDGSPRLSRP